MIWCGWKADARMDSPRILPHRMQINKYIRLLMDQLVTVEIICNKRTEADNDNTRGTRVPNQFERSLNAKRKRRLLFGVGRLLRVCAVRFWGLSTYNTVSSEHVAFMIVTTSTFCRHIQLVPRTGSVVSPPVRTGYYIKHTRAAVLARRLGTMPSASMFIFH